MLDMKWKILSKDHEFVSKITKNHIISITLFCKKEPIYFDTFRQKCKIFLLFYIGYPERIQMLSLLRGGGGGK